MNRPHTCRFRPWLRVVRGPASNGGYVDPDVMLGIGAQLRLSHVRVIPEAGVDLGPIGLYGQLGATVFFDFAPNR